MKTYSEMLKEAIEESSLTLEQIVERCKRKGLDIHATYISKLRLGKAQPPSPEITQTLAEVIGFDADKFIWQGFIDRSPDELKDILEAIDDKIIKLFFTLYNGQITREQFQSLLSESLLLDIKQTKIEHHKPTELLREYMARYSYDDDEADHAPDNQVEIVGVLSTEPVDKVRLDFEGFEYVSPHVFRGHKGFAMKIQGNALANHSIFNGDRILVAITKEHSPNDILYVKTDESSITLCKLKESNGMCVLIPLNGNMEVILTHKENVQVVGKVVEIRRTFK